MAKTRAVTMISLSLAMGVAAAWMAGNWARQSSEASEVPMATVVAADIAVPFGTKVAERHLKTLHDARRVRPARALSRASRKSWTA